MILAHVEVVKSLNNVMEKMLRLAKKKDQMKVFYISLIALLILITTSCCKKVGSGTDPDYPIYSYNTEIINPPEKFQVNYIVSAPGPRMAKVTFADDAVWVIDKLGNNQILYSVDNGSDKLAISVRDTIGFEGGKQYSFDANNTNNVDVINFLVEFRQTGDNYESFEPKW